MAGGSYRILTRPAEGQYKDRGSRFIAYLMPIQTEIDARQAVDSIRASHHAARHVCYAILTDSASAALFNDDGEPSGSAGRPILHALQRVGLSYVVGTVVRYFGGIKLGVPGLIAAYRGAVENALATADIEERVAERSLSLQCPYGAMNDLIPYIKKSNGRLLSERYEATICHLEVAWPEASIATVAAWTKSYGVDVRIEGDSAGTPVLPAPYDPAEKTKEENKGNK